MIILELIAVKPHPSNLEQYSTILLIVHWVEAVQDFGHYVLILLFNFGLPLGFCSTLHVLISDDVPVGELHGLALSMQEARFVN